MGYDFHANNPDVEMFYLGGFSWPWMLSAGVGLIIGQGDGLAPGQYFYQPDESGFDPLANDGYHVTANQAKMMVAALRGLVHVERHKRRAWETLTSEERSKRQDSRLQHIYNNPVREDFVDKAEAMANWTERSGGFRIH